MLVGPFVDVDLVGIDVGLAREIEVIVEHGRRFPRGRWSGLEGGIPVKTISTRLGHATTAFTQDVYMHNVPALEESAAEQIADLIFNAPTEGPPSDEEEPPTDSDESP